MKKELEVISIDGEIVTLAQEATGRQGKYFRHEGVKFVLNDPILIAAIEDEDVMSLNLSTEWVEHTRLDGETNENASGPGYTRGVVDSYMTFSKKLKRAQKTSSFNKQIKALDVEAPELVNLPKTA